MRADGRCSLVILGLAVAACGSGHSATATSRATATATTIDSATSLATPAPSRSTSISSPTVPTPDAVSHRTARLRFAASTLGPGRRAEIERTSWHPGCPVALNRLRYLRIPYWGFDHRTHLGEMVVNAVAVSAVHRAFATLLAAGFPIRRMRLVDRYRGSDYASIQADNTSSFNCRDATGSSRWSEHAYGLAIDINPIENPYVYANGTTTHPASDPFLNRADVRPGMAVAGGTLVRAFAAVGWGWGGRWPRPTDFQHFSINGR